MNSSYKVVIPARYQSSRLPGKPLVKIAGIPMIERTWRQCLKTVPAEDIIIATDDERIIDHCNSIGAISKMTPESCLTGTDRVAALLEHYDVNYFINVQGDEPVLNPQDLSDIITETIKGTFDVINGFAPIVTEEEFFSRSVPKVICTNDNQLMYMSRGPVPANKSGKFVKGWRQICIYSFSRKALELFGSVNGKTPMEEIEDIEILRFVELGMPVKMIPMSDQSIAVDNPEDILKVETYLKSIAHV